MQSRLPLMSRLDMPLQKIALVLGRMLLGLLFFTQLWWKVPPTFGCPADFAFTTADGGGNLRRTSGLCDWIGIESVWSTRPHPILVADMGSVGGPKLSIDIGLLSRANGLFIDNVVKPNIRIFGFMVWGMEAFIFVSLFFGILTRLGALVAIFQSLQLWVGLAGISNPGEWEWGYNWMPVMAFLVFAFAPLIGFGIDSLLRPRLKPAADKGSRVSQLLYWLM
ncbi:MAG: hypothetical protein ABI847_04670 [Anaerolineales bacterium]